ncbi:MAG: exosortase system-associated protein, TIGR04073 family [Methylococcaceae bacterium]|nr:exosortase system-associated protein, TIGR04073 family [Methylococcaceae bacterium]
MSLKQKLYPLALMIVLCSISVHADEEGGPGYPAKIAGKFGLGFINVATGLVEIPKTMVVESSNEGITSGLTLGFVKGVGHMMGRSVLGILDVVSFPIPTRSMVTPPVVWQDFDQETSYSNGWEMY